MPGRDGTEPSSAWSAQHDGLAPSGLVAGWLRVVDAVAGPLVRLRVTADAVTGVGLLVAVLAVPAAARGWAVAAGVAILLSGLLDGLDGAVARRAGPTRHGAVLDRVADRLGEVAAGVALVLLGAPWWLAALAVVLGGGLEAVRTLDRRRGADPRPPTVGERPTRVFVAGMFAVAEGATAGWDPAWSDLPWPGVGAAVWTVVVAIGLGQAARSGR